MAPILPWIIGATAVMGLINRNAAQGKLTAAEDATHQRELEAQQARLATIPPWEQQEGSMIQGFAERGLRVDPNTPAVQEALRRRNTDIAAIKAGNAVTNASWDVHKAAQAPALSGPDPLGLLFNVFGNAFSPTAPATDTITSPSPYPVTTPGQRDAAAGRTVYGSY